MLPVQIYFHDMKWTGQSGQRLEQLTEREVWLGFARTTLTEISVGDRPTVSAHHTHTHTQRV